MPTARWNVDLPTANELPALPRGIVLHWTGGGLRANPVDLNAYHFVVEHDGAVRSGRWDVAANMRQVGGDDYAMHTGGFNSFRIGIAAAGMKDYLSPSDPGSALITEEQVRRMTELAAYFLALAGQDPLDPRRLCTHREVWTLHSIKGTRNHLKKDIEFLPFRRDLARDEVGDYLRALIAEVIATSPFHEPIVVEPGPVLPPAVPSPVIDIAEPVVTPPAPEPILPTEETPWWRRLMARIRR